MNDYTHFEAEDFLMDAAFIAWVKHPTEEANQFWNQFLQENPTQRPAVQLAIATLQTLQFQPANLPDNFFADLKTNIDFSIQKNEEGRKISGIRKRSNGLKVAAIFIGIVTGASLLYWYLQPAAVITITTAYQQIKTVELPDHSIVTLNANSSLQYPEKWSNDHREVTLTGEAFFKITHIEQAKGAAPFTVHSGSMNVQVLGTEFNVKNREQNVEVMLQSGKVQLQINGNTNMHVMRPNDFVSYHQRSAYFKSTTVNPSYYTAWLNHRYLFQNVSLAEVCQHLQDYYGLQFIIKNQSLAAKQISGTLLLGDENSLLQTLASILNANVEKQEQQVTIASK